jgi:poly(A) polymerase
MQDVGVLPIVLAGVGYIDTLRRFIAVEGAIGAEPSAPLRLTVLACRIEEDVLRVAARLRLANAERDRMLAGLAAARLLDPPPDVRRARLALYRAGSTAYRDGVLLAAAWSTAGVPAARWGELFTLPARWTAPQFPLSGRDIVGQGAQPSPAVGALLRELETWWIDHDFQPDEGALRQRLQQVMADHD